jgi:hypothetical protein
MLRVFKAKLISYLAYIFIKVEYFFFGNINQFKLDVFRGCFTGFLFYQVAE